MSFLMPHPQGPELFPSRLFESPQPLHEWDLAKRVGIFNAASIIRRLTISTREQMPVIPIAIGRDGAADHTAQKRAF